MSTHRSKFYGRLLCGAAAISLMTAAAAHAEEQQTQFNIAPQPLSSALNEFATQSRMAVLFTPELTDARVSSGLSKTADPETALAMMLEGTDLKWRRNGDTFIIMRASDPQSGSAAGDGADSGTVQALIVTAQKREEDIQDVPIAISAFTQEDLTRSQVAGGPDLMTQVPNFTFTKTNFSSYSIQIRGIGTQAISATTDPAVAVAFNNTPFIRNRFFEQEFYDLQRIEVLRGPQGTLYGRNATAGVVNVLSAKPTHHFEAKASGDIANYGSTRLEGMVNIPLVEDKVALRLAGAWTKRDGYVTNALTGDQIDGRNLWSARLTLGIEPVDWLKAYFIYEHFDENDDRLRSGKQLCQRNPNPTHFGSAELPADTNGSAGAVNAYTSQGCEAGSLYGPEAFQVPNGLALPYFGPLCTIGVPVDCSIDAYASTTQSRDLRVIESQIKPEYNAKSDIVQFQLGIDVGPNLTLNSETAYSTDEIFSFEDFNRFNTSPGVFLPFGGIGNDTITDENGVFCDPQLGCSNRLLGADLSTAKSRQFSQEVRLSSNFDGPFNFSLGANFLRYDTTDKFYVFFNSLGLFAAFRPRDYVPGVSDNTEYLTSLLTSDPYGSYNIIGPKYMDPNGIHSLNDYGRQYFLSKNPYKLISYAVFGEAQYQLTENLKITGGLRWTVDKKRAPIIPSWLVAVDSYGLPVAKVIEEEWREPTGRAVLDWKPDLSFTDETLIYASYAHGYKAGGVNPPLPVNTFGDNSSVANYISALQPPTFEPEFVDAFEIGSKNTLLDGRLTLNSTAFYYDYKGYQISQIANRSAVNRNFDAEVWGAELEIDWRALENLRLGFKGGYENTRMADGSRAIDTMDRTAGNTDWAVMKPSPGTPSNCVFPVSYLEDLALRGLLGGSLINGSGLCAYAYQLNQDPMTQAPYVPNPTIDANGNPLRPELDGYVGFDPSQSPNHGEGFYKDLSGNELPNAPHFTGTLTADYTLPLPNDWLVTLHSDFYYQSEAWTRVFNTPGYDKLKAYTNVNLAAIFTNEDAGWKVMAYVKNVFDRDSITGAFLNSDDTGLTTNVFLTEPRLYGVRVTREWNGGSFLGSGGAHTPGEPYPFSIEVGGGVERIDAPNEVYAPSFMADASQAINPLGTQSEDMDWGDSRQVKFIYQPRAGGWRVSAAARFGKANADNNVENKEKAFTVCLVGPPYEQYCEQSKYNVSTLNYGTAFVHDEESFTLLDFAVGRDVGIGLVGQKGRSTLDVGLRAAEFKSKTSANIYGDVGWAFENDEPYWAFFKYGHHTVGRSSFNADRQFRGAGPVLTWDASRPLIGNDDSGHVNVDWTLTGGVLFGQQTTSISSHEEGRYFRGTVQNLHFGYVDPVVTTAPPVSLNRSRSATVPVFGASLGLSYDIQRVKVSAGYRIDRAYNVLDGGVATSSKQDRTIDGPYFKIAVGFGG